MIERHSITDREEWLRWRRSDVTASAAGALLGLHPWITLLQLYLDKARISPLPEEDNPAMRRGRLLEPLAFELVKEARPEWQAFPPALYLRDPEHRIGGTPNLYARDENGRHGVIEIKTSEPSNFRKTWLDESGEIQVPLWIAIQALVCAHLADAEWCAVGVLRVGHQIDFDIVPIPQTVGLIDRIKEAAAEFWRCIDAHEPPPPVFPADIEAVLRYTKNISTSNEAVELPEGDNYFPEILAEYVRNSAEIKQRRERCESIKAEVLYKLGPATKLTQNGKVLVSAKLAHKKAEEKPRAGYPYRDFRIPQGAATP